MKKINILILGGGQIGQAIAKILKKPSIEINLWDRNLRRTKLHQPFNQVLAQADFVFFCLPAPALRSVSRLIKKNLNPRALVISLTKGLEKSSAKTSFEILKENLIFSEIIILGGPMLANELKQGQPGIGVAACSYPSVFNKLQKIFKRTSVSLVYSADQQGVALAGVLKNVYAVMVGLVDGWGFQNNLKGQVMAKIIAEMINAAKVLKISPETILGAAGIGDFLATSFSPFSWNRKAGEELARFGRHRFLSEGIDSLPLIMKLLKDKSRRFTILNFLKKAIDKPKVLKKQFLKII